MMADSWASVGRRRGSWRHGRELQLNQHHVITQAHCQIQRRFTRQEIVYLLEKEKTILFLENDCIINIFI